jgi:hypothetical protein
LGHGHCDHALDVMATTLPAGVRRFPIVTQQRVATRLTGRSAAMPELPVCRLSVTPNAPIQTCGEVMVGDDQVDDAVLIPLPLPTVTGIAKPALIDELDGHPSGPGADPHEPLDEKLLDLLVRKRR